jgi:hypothetical protein
MKIIIKGSQDIEISSIKDLSMIIPNSFNGKALNYGQGEGQVEIEGIIWGLYYGENNNYFLQYEEGFIDWNKFKDLFEAIIKQIQFEFGSHLKFCVEGKLNHYEPHEKYT